MARNDPRVFVGKERCPSLYVGFVIQVLHDLTRHSHILTLILVMNMTELHSLLLLLKSELVSSHLEIHDV
jgi:hypothetical protein